jgi:AraC-like DNA-binding protein
MAPTCQFVRLGRLPVAPDFVQNPQVSSPTVIRPEYLRAGFAADVDDLGGSGLLHAGEQWAPPAFMITEHTHPTWEFYLQLHGLTRWRAERRLWTVRPGDLFGVAPRTRHAMAEQPGANIHFVYAALDPSRAAARLDDALPGWADRPAVLHLSNAFRLVEPFAQLINEVTTTQAFQPAGLSLAVDRIALEVTRCLQQGGAARALGNHPAVHQIQSLLDRDYARPWPLRDLADRVGLAPNYLAGLFSAEFGCGPHEYQTQRRVARAKQLLVSSDLSITDIATEVGFGSSQHLARTFRQHTGTTPSAFRRGAG